MTYTLQFDVSGVSTDLTVIHEGTGGRFEATSAVAAAVVMGPALALTAVAGHTGLDRIISTGPYDPGHHRG